MLKVNAIGDTCPIPVVKTKDAIRRLGEGGGVVETLVDNEIAVQNLTKMANQKGYGVRSEKLAENEYRVTMTVGAGADLPAENEETVCLVPAGKKNIVAVISADHMGEGEGELGKNLLKAFIYALSQQENLPKTILFYNGGAFLTCEGSLSLEDLKSMAERGVEILTCGTCLNFYGLTEKLAVGGVTNMYDIVEKQLAADRLVPPEYAAKEALRGSHLRRHGSCHGGGEILPCKRRGGSPDPRAAGDHRRLRPRVEDGAGAGGGRHRRPAQRRHRIQRRASHRNLKCIMKKSRTPAGSGFLRQKQQITALQSLSVWI